MPLKRARRRISDYNSNRQKHNKSLEAAAQAASLPLTSMVDMFSVLVIYLIMNASAVAEWVSLGTKIELPKGKYIGDAPQKGATLQINKEMVFGELDVPLITVEKVQKGPFSVPEIKEYLKKQENKTGYVNVVADAHVPFGVMRRVIASCQDAGFKNVNLAIEPTGG